MYIKTTEGLLKSGSGGDGATHINCYSASKSALGRLLTNFSAHGIDHPRYGHFDCLEGYWYWLKSGKCKDLLRKGYGFQMKQRGKHLPRVENPNFQDEFKEGIHLKLKQHPKIYDALLACTLPLAHYYEYSGLIKDSYESCKWVWEEYDLIRKGKPLQELSTVELPEWL